MQPCIRQYRMNALWWTFRRHYAFSLTRLNKTMNWFSFSEFPLQTVSMWHDIQMANKISEAYFVRSRASGASTSFEQQKSINFFFVYFSMVRLSKLHRRKHPFARSTIVLTPSDFFHVFPKPNYRIAEKSRYSINTQTLSHTHTQHMETEWKK